MSLLSFHKMNQIDDAIDRYCRTSSGKSTLLNLNMSTREFKYIMFDMIDVNSKIFNDIMMNYILLCSAIRMRHYDDAEKYSQICKNEWNKMKSLINETYSLNKIEQKQEKPINHHYLLDCLANIFYSNC